MNNKPKNAADRVRVKESKSKESLERELQLSDLKAVLDTKAGRNVMWRFLERGGMFTDGWAPSAKIHFNAGKKNMALFILAEIVEANQEFYFQMMRENQLKGEENVN